MKVIEFQARKGGVGCTAVASCVALHLAQTSKVLIIDSSETLDVPALLGAPAPFYDSASPIHEFSDSYGGIHYFSTTWASAHFGNVASVQRWYQDFDFDFVVIDSGTRTAHSLITSSPMERVKVSVVRNEYLSLRSEVNAPTEYTNGVVRRVALIENDRALTAKDASSVIGGSVVVVKMDDRFARTCDAGLLAMQSRHEVFSEWASQVVDGIAVPA